MINDNTFTPQKISYSQIDTFKQCELKYWHRYINKTQPDPTTDRTAAEIGTVTHETLETFYQQPPTERTETTLKQHCKQAYQTNTYLNQQPQQLTIKQKIWAAASNIFKIENPETISNILTEKKYESNIQGVTITGIVDRITTQNGETTICDYKTGKSHKKHKQQLHLYAALHNNLQPKPTKTQIIYLKTGTNTIHNSSQQNQTKAVNDILNTYEQIAHPNTPKHANNPTHWPYTRTPLCNWCDYKYTCPAFTTKISNTPKPDKQLAKTQINQIKQQLNQKQTTP